MYDRLGYGTLRRIAPPMVPPVVPPPGVCEGPPALGDGYQVPTRVYVRELGEATTAEREDMIRTGEFRVEEYVPTWSQEGRARGTNSRAVAYKIVSHLGKSALVQSTELVGEARRVLAEFVRRSQFAENRERPPAKVTGSYRPPPESASHYPA